jgi:chromosome segregation ATPase
LEKKEKKKNMSYGLNFNASFTRDDDEMNLGAHITDSEGIDISASGTSDSYSDLVEAVTSEIIEQFKEAQMQHELEDADISGDLQENIQRLKDENTQLKERIEQLQKRLNLKEETPVSKVAKAQDDTVTEQAIKKSQQYSLKELERELDALLDDIKFGVSTKKNSRKKYDSPIRYKYLNL